VGTSILVILVAIDLSLAAGYLVALAGLAVYFGFDRNDHLRHAVGILLGLGLLFVGMQMLKSGIRPLRDDLIQGDLFAEAARSPLLLLLLGTVLSLLCQSSSVTGALAIAGTGNGLVDLSGACWLVYGANLGSGVNYALLARTHRGEASQIALMQVMQKFAGFAAVLVVLVIEWATGDKLIERGATALARTTSGQVAWVFLLFQIAGSGICTVFLQHILPLLERAAPPSELQELSKPAYLIEEALVEPAFAIELVTREEHRLLERLPMMLDTIRADAIGPFTSPQTLRAAGTTVTSAMAAYLSSIIDSKLDRAEREQTVRLQHRTANFGAMFESLDEFVNTCKAARQWPSSGRVVDQMVESLHTLLCALLDASSSADAADHELILNLLGHRDELMERIRQRVLREDPDMPSKAQEALFSATMLFERIIWLARRNALLLSPEPRRAQALADGAQAAAHTFD
jgi:phosphate:Na+ symporter